MRYSKDQSKRTVLEMVYTAAIETVPTQKMEIYSLDTAGFIFKTCISFI
jgi:hypothetical protein